MTPPPGHMDDWYKLQDTWHSSGMTQPNHSMSSRGRTQATRFVVVYFQREDIFKSPGAEKQGLLDRGGGSHWGSLYQSSMLHYQGGVIKGVKGGFVYVACL